MKKIYYFLFLLTMACYDDDSQIITSEDVAHNTSELTTMLKSMTTHNASFDDKIDNSSCFSIDFPYEIYVNSDLRTVSAIEDISDINADDSIEIVYPVNTNFFNYDQHQALNQTEFNFLKNTCNQDFNLEVNHCLTLEFPLSVRKFNNLTESFETIQLNNNKEVFQHFDNLHNNDVYELDYPVFLKDINLETIRIDNNQEFMLAYIITEQGCD